MEAAYDYVVTHPWEMMTAVIGVCSFCAGVTVAMIAQVIGRRRG
jgi:hypothetical protein